MVIYFENIPKVAKPVIQKCYAPINFNVILK
jgi:hypothetical protein